MSTTPPEGPGARAGELTIDTTAQLVEQIDYVLTRPDMAGFDCMLAREVLKDPAAKHHAMGYGLRGIRVSLCGVTGLETETHIAVRVIVTPPIKITPVTDGDVHVE